jgi:hypothetical protein
MRVQRLFYEVDKSPSSVKWKNDRSRICTSPYALIACTGTIFPFICIKYVAGIFALRRENSVLNVDVLLHRTAFNT